MLQSAAAVDVGSNAIRLAMVKVNATGVVVDWVYRRYAVRLGTDVFDCGRIRKASAQSLAKAFIDIRERMQAKGVERYRAVCTSAMREARNGPAVVRQIERHTRLRPEIIDASEEGRLARQALECALGVLPRGALLVDLGGGSLELSRRSARVGRSLPFGTVRMLSRYPELNSPLGARQLDAARAKIHRALKRRLGGTSPAKVGVATGGNFDALARLAPAPLGIVAGIDLSQLGLITGRLAAMAPAERAAVYGLRRDRADVIVPAALVISSVIDIFGLRRFIVPGTGIREAVLHALLEEPQEPPEEAASGRPLPQQARAQARLARMLFTQLRPIHGLWMPGLSPLEAAALLRGGASGDRNEAILQLFRPREQEITRAVVAISCGRRIDGSAALTEAERRGVVILGAILGLAAELCRRNVRSVRVNVLTEPISILPSGQGKVPTSAAHQLSQALRLPVRVG